MNIPNELPLKEDILEKYLYNKDIGALRLNKPNSKYIGSESKSINYKYLSADFCKNGKRIKYRIHRIIFFLETGEEPDEVDHIDGNPRNNHISNLRAADRKTNRFNSKGKTGRTSHYKGVCWLDGGWKVYIQVDKKNKFLGKFRSEEDAAKVYDFNAKKLFGEFARLNFSEEFCEKEQKRTKKNRGAKFNQKRKN